MQRTLLNFIRTTLVGGVIFLLPLLLVALLAQQAMKLAVKLARPATAMLPATLADSVAVGAVITLLAVLVLAFVAGMFARTAMGQGLFQWLENSLIGSLPQFSFVRGIAESLGEGDDSSVEVVLVPTDAGLQLGFIFAPTAGPWQAVFLPGAPQWTSGSLVYAERSNMRPAGIGFAAAMKTLKKLGADGGAVLRVLAAGGA